MWKPDGVRIGLVTSPAFMPAMTSPRNVGSSGPLRQPSEPPSSAVCALENDTASWPKSSPAVARL